MGLSQERVSASTWTQGTVKTIPTLYTRKLVGFGTLTQKVGVYHVPCSYDKRNPAHLPPLSRPSLPQPSHLLPAPTRVTS